MKSVLITEGSVGAEGKRQGRPVRLAQRAAVRTEQRTARSDRLDYGITMEIMMGLSNQELNSLREDFSVNVRLLNRGHM